MMGTRLVSGNCFADAVAKTRVARSVQVGKPVASQPRGNSMRRAKRLLG